MESADNTSDLPEIVIISQLELRRLFNELNLWRKAQAGELYKIVEAHRHPTPPWAEEPDCTTSNLVCLRDPMTGINVAKVHYYLRTDGTMGASGLPDPKQVLSQGILYVADASSSA